MATPTVKLGARTYEIHPLPIKKAREWRKTFEQPILTVLGTADAFGKLASKEFTNERELLTQVGTLAVQNAPALMQVLLGSIDLILECLYSWSEEISKDREYIESVAYDDEAIKAFLVVLGVAYPFGNLLAFLSKIGTGPAPTSQS